MPQERLDLLKIAGVMQMSTSGGDQVHISTPSNAFFPLNVSQDGAELLVKDNQGTDFRGRFGVFQSLEVRPFVWTLLLRRTRPGLPMEGCWFTPTEASCLWPRMTDGIPKGSFG